MEVESSNTIQPIVIPDTHNGKETQKSPIMLLFERLITNDKEQNTMLTNAQLIEILQIEFNIDISEIHELEVDIYLSVIKKFLLHWPQWDEFDAEVNRLKKHKDNNKIERVLNDKYVKLKEYLRVMVDVAKTKAQELVKAVESSQNSENSAKSKTKVPDKETVVMEIFCNRSQLNELIVRYPQPDQNNTIFNTTTSIPNTIIMAAYDFKTILRYFNIKVSFIEKDISFTYQMSLNYQHTILNKKHSTHAYEKVKLNDELQKKNEKKTKKTVPVSTVYDVLIDFVLNTAQFDFKLILIALIDIFVIDFWEYEFLDVPGRYKKYISKYPYVRYMYVDGGEERSKYDLCLEEVVTPSVSYTFTHIDSAKIPNKVGSPATLTVGCYLCSLLGKDVAVKNILGHFNEVHYEEKQLTCTNCSKKLNVFEIGDNGWYHEC